MTMPTKKKTSNKGRPKSELSKRYMIRTTNERLANWEALAEYQNLDNASTLVRKTMDDKYRKALHDLTPSERKKLEERSAEICAQMDAA